MEALIDILKRALETKTLDEDATHFELLPPLDDAELRAFEARLPCALPESVRALLKYARGLEGGRADRVDFTGQLPFAHEEVFHDGLPIAGDGFGNFWVVDLTPRSTDFGPIYFACHDPPVVAVQSQSLGEFLADLLRVPSSDDLNPVDFVHEQATLDIWKRNSGALNVAEARSSSDPILREFAKQAWDGCFVVDLRGAKTGAGFSWGRFGAKTRIVRHATEPIFAYGKRA